MSAKIAVVIPVYREEINELEKISLDRCRKVLRRYPLIFVAPEGKIFSYFEPGDMIAHFPAEYFQSTQTYSLLLMSPQFYEAFSDFDYILIYQLDAFVFYDALEDFCSLGYDYIGAPWPRHAWQGKRYPKTPQVGNGGFSLRKVKECHKLVANVDSSFPGWQKIDARWVEDSLFASYSMAFEYDFKIAPVSVAELFAMDYFPDRHVKKIGGLPFGCHNWTKYGANFYVELFPRFGYDLRPFREQMSNADYDFQLPNFLEVVALNRLNRRIERGQQLLRYLPTKKFASIRVIRSLAAMKILSRLLTDENSLTDKIFIYDEENWTDLLKDVTRENLPHLVIVADYDVSLISAVENRGLRYGEHVISFRQEYLKRCEELFHGLGR